MHLLVTRLDERRYQTVITRRDGACFHVNGVGHMFAIPHDLAHLAVEEALRLRHGFWGTVADGAVFASMTHLRGRRKPHAALRSHELLKTNKSRITEAEVLVSIFNNALEEGLGPESPTLRARLREYSWTPPGQRPREFTDLEIAAVCAAWRRMLGLWQQLPVGGTLEFTWPAESSARTRQARQHQPA
jgi:hypothetical protein